MSRIMAKGCMFDDCVFVTRLDMTTHAWSREKVMGYYYHLRILQVCKHNCGPVEELSIFSHEFLHKHLGVARLLFQDADAALNCVNKFNDATLMGKKLHVFLDPFGEQTSTQLLAANTKYEFQILPY